MKHNYNLKIIKSSFSIIIVVLLSLGYSNAQTPVVANGKLSVSGVNMVNANGTPVQLRGMSSHGPQWFGKCYNFNSINTLTTDWGIDIFRLAMYVEENGYTTNPDYWKQWIDYMVDICEQHGIYCLIDWHILTPGDPNTNLAIAKDFWDYMSKKHSGKEHVIYEICNEPNGIEWSRVKEYANEIIPIIRANDPNTIIIVGTPNWCQDVDIAAESPIQGDNIMYSLHFYAGTHLSWLRDKAMNAINAGLPIFVTEFGTSQASGDGGPYIEECDKWMSFMEENKISWCNWSFSDKDEISAALTTGACNSNWNNTSTSGTYIKQKLLSPADAWANTGGNIAPVINIESPKTNSYYEIGDSILITTTAIDRDGTIDHVTFYANNSSIGVSSQAPYTLTWVPNTAAQYNINAVITDNESAQNTSTNVVINVVTEIIQDPYPNVLSPASIPGTVLAVNFDTGGEGIAYHDADMVNKGVGGIRTEEGVDTEGGDGVGNIGYVETEEWLEYTVNVIQSGTYDLEMRYASEPGGGKFHLEFDEVDKTGLLNVGSSGSWGTYANIVFKNIRLNAGIQVMRIYIDAGDFNFSKLTFSQVSVEEVPVTNLTLSDSLINIETQQTRTITATISPQEATDKTIRWVSSNESVASIDLNGTVTALSQGETVITAYSSATNIKDSCLVIVNANNVITYLLNINTNGMGVVNSSPASNSYPQGTIVKLIAIPDTNYHFNRWSGDSNSLSDTINIIMDTDKYVTAIFTQDTTFNACAFNTPLATPLASINKSYNNIYVLGTGPNLDNITNFTINWDLNNNGLWQFSISTNNGEPGWYNNLIPLSIQNFSSANPSISLSNTNITGLDGEYWVTTDGDNFVMAQKTGVFTIYFSNSDTAPCLKSASISNTPIKSASSQLVIFPNPASDYITVGSVEKGSTISVINMRGQVVFNRRVTKNGQESFSIKHLNSGGYIIVLKKPNGMSEAKKLYIKSNQ
ncbi:cellulase family glycosylhydrolase [Saccharicrinis fermentans]|uniref:Endoglucanase n=1 Tax=Saccharicrinis fermentans DSM 9555 = JCM 21142 TaxID=869213 RepID=W7Y491_9BACT|nr:cellulase family glycosylhydrolase [Saccharicrinis fermentans]GAF05695.1 endoglucanase precursor [Saccharicrinis fermentans DSM 9555 = JCM 21142]